MSNDMEMRARLILDHKEAIKSIKATAKEADKAFKKNLRAEAKHNVAKKRELSKLRKSAASEFKAEVNNKEKLHRMQQSQWRKEDLNRRKVQREQQRVERDRERGYKSEERASKRSRLMSGVGSTAGKLNVGLGKLVTGALGGVGGFMIGGAIAAYQKHIQVAKATSQMIGMQPGGMIGSNLNGPGFGTSLGFNSVETAQHKFAAGRATGTMSPIELQQFMRSGGLGSGEASQAMGALRQSGLSFAQGSNGGPSEGGKAAAKMIKLGLYSGLEKARFPEFAKGVTTLLKSQGAMLAGKVGNGAAITMGMLGKTGLAGFQGERGAALASKINQSIMNPKDAWATGVAQRSFGYGGSGGGASWWTARKRMQQGTSDPTNMLAILDQIISEQKPGDATYAAVEKFFGGGASQAQAMVEARNSGKFDLADAKKYAANAKPPEEQAADAMKGVGSTLEKIAKNFNEFADAGKQVAPLMQDLQDKQREAFKAMLPGAIEATEYAIRTAGNTGKILGFMHEKWGGGAVKQAAKEVKSVIEARRNMKVHSTGRGGRGTYADAKERYDMARKVADAREHVLAVATETNAQTKGQYTSVVTSAKRKKLAEHVMQYMKAAEEQNLGIAVSDIPTNEIGQIRDPNSPGVKASILANAATRQREHGYVNPELQKLISTLSAEIVGAIKSSVTPVSDVRAPSAVGSKK